MPLAKAARIDPQQVNFVLCDGGGELLPALLDSKIAFVASGLGEFLDQVDSGPVRALAATSERPVEALKEMPTLKSAGVDMTIADWRGIDAPPEVSDGKKQTWIDALTQLHNSAEWKVELTKRRWSDAFNTCDEFGPSLTDHDNAVATT